VMGPAWAARAKPTASSKIIKRYMVSPAMSVCDGTTPLACEQQKTIPQPYTTSNAGIWDRLITLGLLSLAPKTRRW